LRVFARPARWLTKLPLIHNTRFRLTVLVLLAALPAFALLTLTASEQRSDAIAAGREEAQRLVSLSAADQDRLIDSANQLLTTLGRLPEIRGNDSQACHNLLLSLIAAYPDYTDLAVVKRDGSVICSAISNQTNVDESIIKRTFARNAFQIGNYEAAASANQPTIGFAAPVLGSGTEPTRAVYAAVDLQSLNQRLGTFAAQAKFKPGSILTVYDSNGIVLVQYPAVGDTKVIGTSLASSPAVKTMLAQQTGVETVAGSDGQQYIMAYQTAVGSATDSGSGTAYVSLAVPSDEVLKLANASFQKNLGRLGIAALLAVVAAWIFADLFVRRDHETRKALVSELYQAFSSGSVDDLDEIVAPELVDHNPAPGQAAGLEGLKQVIAEFRAAFPDGEIVPQELLADHDKVVARVTLTGTQVANFFGIPSMGRPVTANGVETFRFASGLIVESWSMFGQLVPILPSEDDEGLGDLDHHRRGLLARLLRRR
jgi:steroid delta-isomerase-like uncharacterized protein